MKRTTRLKNGILMATCATLVAATSSAADPKEASDNSWISVSGTVVETSPDSFRLDYAGGVITVEMDDFDFFQEGRLMMENDKVVVYGIVDNDLFEKKTIEASSVFVEDLQTHFYANASDEEDFVNWTVSGPIIVGEAQVSGYVTSIDGREFTINTGLQSIQVDTDEMGYDPMDDKGYLEIDLGDFVKVSGEVDPGLFEDHEIEADWIVELR